MKIRQFKMKNNFKIILIFVFLCLDLTWWINFLKIELPFGRTDTNYFFVALGLLILACILIPYYVSQILIVRCVDTLLRTNLQGVSRWCVLISLVIAILYFTTYALVQVIVGIDALYGEFSMLVEWGGVLVSLILYKLGRYLMGRSNIERESNETNENNV